jgi:large subunit ribosomal protein L3
MLSNLIGRKIGMMELFGDDGRVSPVTVIEAGPCSIVQVKKQSGIDKYNAVQICFGKPRRKVPKGLKGHYDKAKVQPCRMLREFRCSEEPKEEAGAVIGVEIFEGVGLVDIIGTVKGRGFQGVVKRFHKACGPKSHGSMQIRQLGAASSAAMPGHIRPGQIMPGHMGCNRITTRNIRLVKIDKEKNLLFVHGAVPGAKGGYVVVRKSARQPKAQAGNLRAIKTRQ